MEGPSLDRLGRHDQLLWVASPSCALSKDQALVKGLGLCPHPGPDISSHQLNPRSSQEVKNVTPQSGPLKFKGGDAYLMGLNKAFLQRLRQLPQGWGQAAGEPPCPWQPPSHLSPSSVCGRTAWHSKLLWEPSAGPSIINIMRTSEELCE